MNLYLGLKRRLLFIPKNKGFRNVAKVNSQYRVKNRENIRVYEDSYDLQKQITFSHSSSNLINASIYFLQPVLTFFVSLFPSG